MNPVTEQTIYHNLAERYQETKKRSILNILQCGKILYEAKQAMPHGMFGEFLSDTRVSESERTSQRLMAIFKNYRHLLDKKDMDDAISHLGVSHLLELQKLPRRFRKEIEIVHEDKGKEVKEIVEVIDEERLGDFLAQKVDFNGEVKPVRDLPLNEMKKYIKEAQGVFEPGDEEDVEPEAEPVVLEQPIDITPEPVKEGVPDVMPSSEIEVGGFTPDIYGEIVGDLAKLSGTLYRLNDKVEKIDNVILAEISDIQKDSLERDIKKTLEQTSEYVRKIKKVLEQFE